MTRKLWAIYVSLQLPAPLLCRHLQASYRAFLPPFSCISCWERRKQRTWNLKTNKAQHNQSFLCHGFLKAISQSLKDWVWQQQLGWVGPEGKKKKEIDMKIFSFPAGPGLCMPNHFLPPPPYPHYQTLHLLSRSLEVKRGCSSFLQTQLACQSWEMKNARDTLPSAESHGSQKLLLTEAGGISRNCQK